MNPAPILRNRIWLLLRWHKRACRSPFFLWNWCWTYIGYCYEVTSSKRVHKEDWKDSGVPFYRTRELVKLSENGYVDNELFIANDLPTWQICSLCGRQCGAVREVEEAETLSY